MYSVDQEGQLTLFPPGTREHANLLVLPGSEKAKEMTAISGQKLSGYWHRSDPVGLLVKTLLDTSHWDSTTCFLTWRTSGTPLNRLYFQLHPSEHRTEETGYSLLPTMTACEWKGRGPNSKQQGLTNALGVTGANLDPTWVEWFMGFPKGWSDLNHLETQSYLSKSIPS